MKAYSKILILLVIFSSCQSERLYEMDTPIPSAKWDMKDVQTFPVEINDTNMLCNVFINIRHNGTYSFSNLYLFSTIYSPAGISIRDTLEVFLADEKGKWYGCSGLGDIYYLRKMYKKNIRFSQAGSYKFFIEQAMRSKVLEGITDIGVRIERVEK